MSTSWNTHSEGFVPPAQLRKSRQHSQTAVARMGSTIDSQQPESRPQHTRSASFFSFTSKKSAQQQAHRATLQVASTHQRSPTSASDHVSLQTSPTTPTKRPSLGDAPSMNPNPSVQREIKSVVDLALAHAHKIYFSGALVRRVERLPDGNRPARDEGWVDVWAQLGGTTLSVWDMKAIEEASKRGEEVPPSYINVTDSFIQVLGALTSPATATTPAKRYTNVITLNTAGSNLIFFACPSSADLISWATSLRLASWEKSRLEEIYTGHLLRMSLSENDKWKEPATTLVKGKLEGQVKLRIAGHTDWKPMWMVLSSSSDGDIEAQRPNSPLSMRSKNRMSNLFARVQSQSPSGPAVPVISFYPSQKPKDRKKPVLTMRYVSQAYAVYPERPEVIQMSTLMKVEGLLGHEDLAGTMKGKECWLMIMPETQQTYPVFELLKWLVALHDAYSLYGRIGGYIWDPRHSSSMWFAYPVGAQRPQLFLEREAAEILDPRDDRTSAIRRELKQVLINRSTPGFLPPGQAAGQGTGVHQTAIKRSVSSGLVGSTPQADPATSASGPQLPPLNFNGNQAQQSQGLQLTTPLVRGVSSLSPISESNRSADPVVPKPPSNTTTPQDSANSSILGGHSVSNHPAPERNASASSSLLGGGPSVSGPTPERGASANGTFSGGPLVSEPMPERKASPSGNFMGGRLALNATEKPHPVLRTSRGSADSSQGSRPDSKLAQSPSYTSSGFEPDSKPQYDNTSPRTTSPITSRSPISIQSFHSPSQSRSLTSNIVTSTREQSQVSEMPPVLGSRSHSPAPGPQSLRGLSQTSPPQEVSQARQSPPPTRLSPPPNRPTTPSPLAKRHTPDTPDPPPKSDSGTPIVAKWGSPQPSQVPDATQLVAQSPVDNDLANEAGALYLLQQQAEVTQRPLGTWTTDEEEEEEDDDHDSDFTGPERNPPPRRATPPVQPPSAYRHPVGVAENQIVSVAGRSVIGRKPSGARAKPTPRRYADQSTSAEHISSPLQSPISTSGHPMVQPQQPSAGYDDNADALAALTFLENQEEPAPPQDIPPPQSQKDEPGPLQQPSEGTHYPSTFAPSRQAAERKAKAQALQEASYAATHLPGKPNGNVKEKRKDQGAWAESSDEEEEDDEEEDDEDGSDDERPLPQMKQPQPVSASDPRASVYPSAQPGFQGSSNIVGDGFGRQARTLPLPPSRTGDSQDHHNTHPRTPSGQYDDRPRTHIGDEPRSHTTNPHQVARQSVWSTVLDPQPPPRNTSGKDTFVQVEDSETMTKAFQPQGLLSAGLQDKEDRSAKRQEELARETGASLINVPNKPPPPQTGLLGAITAHERERKREGGVGAALTEKERERRLAEERQRKLDELQRQQLDQMSQGGAQGPYDVYGQQQFPGFAPGFDPRMSMNPMMLNPYMAGGYPMMPFGNTQQMMAAQLAAQQAYQQAMMSFSQAGGSQLGDNMSRAGAPAGPSPQMGSPSPIQGGMMGMDPRMSMGMNPWMSGGMGMGMNSMAGGMGMGPMGMMDPRMSMGQQNYNFQRPDAVGQGLMPTFQGTPQGTPSPRQGSPAPQRSSNNSPRPPPT